MTEILVVGFPKSGNTWLSRLLSDALGWPVRGIHDARPLAEQGEDHKDGHVIRQLHLYPQECDGKFGAIASPFTFNTAKYNGHHKIIHIIRDPRDVSVAINHYWGIKDLQRTITHVMSTGEHPLWGCGWSQYVGAWQSAPVPVLETRYEWLHEDTLTEMRRIFDRLELRPIRPLEETIERESFENRRARIRGEEGENMAHGKGAQLANLRGGRVGDWRQEFGPEEITAFADRFTLELLKLGYEDDPEWHLAGVRTC